MKQNLTEMVFILDRSGSMRGLEKDTIGGYNGLIEKQRLVDGEASITTVLFDDGYELLHSRCNVKDVKDITENEYYVRGCTALMDAVGRTIDSIGAALAREDEGNRPSKVVFVIITDGMENASTQYSTAQIKKMIEHQRNKYNWEFIFLGANIDAVETAKNYGINKERAVTYCADKQGTSLSYRAVSNAVECIRMDMNLDESWKEDIEMDCIKRGGKV